MTQAELLEIRKEQASILDRILNTPGEIERIAQREYGDRWRIIYADENHPNNVYLNKLQISKENNAKNKKTWTDY